ncbi:MAG: prepilin-type N-terminal cleavage/methylation domain-containing protein [Patescibacteria group bacterium UBA2103]
MEYKNTHRGFTLVETLVAIFVLTISITGPLFIAQQSFSSANTARDRTTAAFLAQEAIEYVRSVRDHNYLSNESNWLQDLTPCVSGNCIIDTSVSTYPSITSCGGTCPALKQTDAGLFGYQSGDDTRFVRSISITSIQAHEVLVSVDVSWTYKGTTRTFSVEERLFDWL